MAYTQVTLEQFVGAVSQILDDPGAVYWPVQQIQFAVWEGLRVWGALTGYWRERGVWQGGPQSPTWEQVTSPWAQSPGTWATLTIPAPPVWDLSLVLPALRPRTYTLGQLVTEVQYDLLEQPSGISGANASGQVPIGAILQAVVRARNRFALDARLPIVIVGILLSPPPPDGLVSFDQSVALLHRANWLDLYSGAWTNLWREDSWALDHGNTQWPIEPGTPLTYSESDIAPLAIQLSPPPLNEGIIEGLLVQSILLDTTNAGALLRLPDEWVWAVKYAALADLLSSGDQIADPMRAQYAEERYSQAVTFAQDAKSLLRVTANGLPLALDTLAALDAGQPNWRNQTGPPSIAGALYDLVAVSPGITPNVTGFAADVVRAAPIPVTGSQFIPLGAEDLDHLMNYVLHVLQFKCGGDEFKATMTSYDQWLGAVASRKGVNAAKIRYLSALFSQPQREWAQRPDRIEVNANA